jgi:hypothetical protein
MKPSGAVRACRRVAQLLKHGSNEWDKGTIRCFFYPRDVEEILKDQATGEQVF